MNGNLIQTYDFFHKIVDLQSLNFLGTVITTKPDTRPLTFSFSTAGQNCFSLRVAPM